MFIKQFSIKQTWLCCLSILCKLGCVVYRSYANLIVLFIDIMQTWFCCLSILCKLGCVVNRSHANLVVLFIDLMQTWLCCLSILCKLGCAVCRYYANKNNSISRMYQIYSEHKRKHHVHVYRVKRSNTI